MAGAIRVRAFLSCDGGICRQDSCVLGCLIFEVFEKEGAIEDEVFIFVPRSSIAEGPELVSYINQITTERSFVFTRPIINLYQLLSLLIQI